MGWPFCGAAAYEPSDSSYSPRLDVRHSAVEQRDVVFVAYTQGLDEGPSEKFVPPRISRWRIPSHASSRSSGAPAPLAAIRRHSTRAAPEQERPDALKKKHALTGVWAAPSPHRGIENPGPVRVPFSGICSLSAVRLPVRLRGGGCRTLEGHARSRQSDIMPFPGGAAFKLVGLDPEGTELGLDERAHAFRAWRRFRLDVTKFRKLVALDRDDSLSRFGLGQALFQKGGIEAFTEAAEHLLFASTKAPDHLATYHVLGQVLIKLGRNTEARDVLSAGCEKAKAVGEGMGRDLGPAMADLLSTL